LFFESLSNAAGYVKTISGHCHDGVTLRRGEGGGVLIPAKLKDLFGYNPQAARADDEHHGGRSQLYCGNLVLLFPVLHPPLAINAEDLRRPQNHNSPMRLWYARTWAWNTSADKVALIQRNVALIQRNVALIQRNVALIQRNVALIQRNVALIQRNVALIQR